MTHLTEKSHKGVLTGSPITDMKLNLAEKMVLKKALDKISGTDVEKLLKAYHVI